MTTASKLAAALHEIPELLLDAEHLRARETALVSLQALGAMKADSSVLVVIGGGGSGKSSVVNALVGSDVAPASAVRPTTVGVAVIGRSNPAVLGGVADYIYTDRLHDGIVVVDTPSWDHERDAVLSVVVVAHTVVVVVTPARYGDSVTSEIVRALPDRANVVFVANRMPADPEENDEVLDDIEATFDREVHVQIVEGEAIELPASLLANLPVDEDLIGAMRLHERTAAGHGRTVARGVSAGATDLGSVQSALTQAIPTLVNQDLECSDDWVTTRDALVGVARDALVAFDDVITTASGNDLATRVRRELSMPDAQQLAADLDAWRVEVAEAFHRLARPRWRRKATLDLVEHWSWMLSVDSRVKPPRRVGRAMRGMLLPTITNARESLFSILSAGVQRRPSEWADVVSGAGSYRPGELYAASDALDGGELTDE